MKRTPANKGKRTSRRRKSRMALRNKADRLFSLAIRKRDGHCQHCGRSGPVLQCAHIISRRYTNDGLRWDMLNAITLCQRCHVFFTYRPLEWEAHIEDQYPGRLKYLKARALGPVKKPDLEAVVEALIA